MGAVNSLQAICKVGITLLQKHFSVDITHIHSPLYKYALRPENLSTGLTKTPAQLQSEVYRNDPNFFNI